MTKQLNKYTWLLAVWLMLATVSSYAQVAQPAAWSTTPTMSEDVNTSFSFKSTSSYTPIVGSKSYTSELNAPTRGPRKERTSSSFGWGEPEDNPIGTVPNPTPVGEPLILLVMAMAGAIAVYLRNRRRSSEPTQGEMILSGNE